MLKTANNKYQIENYFIFVSYRYNTVDFNRSRDIDAHLKMDMTSVLYVHTQRFVAELQAFFRHFSQLQKLLGSIRSARKVSLCQVCITFCIA